MNLQDIIAALDRYWSRRGCSPLRPCDLEKSSGTFSPSTFFGVLTPGPFSSAGVEPCRRPGDGRFGENPDLLSSYFSYHVVMKPPPKDMQKVFMSSLAPLGIRTEEHDIRWIESDLDLPALGASGPGWKIYLDGIETVRFTYLRRMASLELAQACAEISYGLERLAMIAQGKKRVLDVRLDERRTYGEMYGERERQLSYYAFEGSDPSALRREMEDGLRGASSLLDRGHYFPAYDLIMRCCRCLELLDARRALPPAERASVIEKISSAAGACAAAYLGPGAVRTPRDGGKELKGGSADVPLRGR